MQEPESTSEGTAALKMQEPQSPKDGSLSPTRPRKRRQNRTVYSIEQRLQLEEFFKIKHYGTYEERVTLADKMNLQEQQVQVWLKNRRAKHRRLQRLCGQQGPGAPAAPQGRGICAPAPAGPAFQGDPELLPSTPEEPVFSANAVLPDIPLHYGGTGFCSSPPPTPPQAFAEAEPCVFSYSQACWRPEQSYQGAVAIAPAPAPAQAGVSPQGPYAFSFSPDPVVTPGFPELCSSQGPFSSCHPWAEKQEDPYKLLDL